MTSYLSRGARYYGAMTLPLYDMAVLRVVVPLAWGCPLSEERALYERCVGARHLDIGVASGYFLDKAAWPVPQPQIALMDLNPKSVRYAAHRLRRFDPEQAIGDARQPFPFGEPFDSIGLFHLIHCIPGGMAEKAAVFDHAARALAPGGVVFGASVTPADRPRNLFARGVLTFSNRLGALNNRDDSHAALKAALEARFADTRVWARGAMTLWEARSPRTASA